MIHTLRSDIPWLASFKVLEQSASYLAVCKSANLSLRYATNVNVLKVLMMNLFDEDKLRNGCTGVGPAVENGIFLSHQIPFQRSIATVGLDMTS